MPISTTPKTADERIQDHFTNFDALLTSKNVDYDKLITAAQRIVMLISHSTAQVDHHHTMAQLEEIWIRVHEVKGTYNSKVVLVLTIISAGLTIVSGLTGLVSIVPGTSLGTTLAGKGFTFLNGGLETGKKIYTVSDAIGKFGQGTGMFPNIAEKVQESERVLSNAHLDEAKQKRQDRKDSQQRNKQQLDRAHQHAREDEQKRSQIKSEMMRAGA